MALQRSIALIGMMGAGKSAIGRLLAARIGVSFVDVDTEIETAAGCDIAGIFARDGEAVFREAEHRMIARLLDRPACVLATGGGAFMDPRNRRVIAEKAYSVWLKVTFDLLWQRVSRRCHRPLLRLPDPKDRLRDLLVAREPVYAGADITVACQDEPKPATTDRVMAALAAHGIISSAANQSAPNEGGHGS